MCYTTYLFQSYLRSIDSTKKLHKILFERRERKKERTDCNREEDKKCKYSPLSLRSMYSAACSRAAMLIFPRFGVILAASVHTYLLLFPSAARSRANTRDKRHDTRVARTTLTTHRRARARTTAARMKEERARYVIVMSSAATPRRLERLRVRLPSDRVQLRSTTRTSSDDDDAYDRTKSMHRSANNDDDNADSADNDTMTTMTTTTKTTTAAAAVAANSRYKYMESFFRTTASI